MRGPYVASIRLYSVGARTFWFSIDLACTPLACEQALHLIWRAKRSVGERASGRTRDSIHVLLSRDFSQLFPNGEFARRPALPSNLWLVLVRVESVPIEQDLDDYSIELSEQRLEAKFHLLARSQRQVFHTVLFPKSRRKRITRYSYLHHYWNLRETVTISILQGLRPSLGVTGYALSKSLILRCVLVSLSSAMKFTGLMGAPSVDIDINVTSRVESGEISNPLGFPLSGLRRTVRPTSFVTHREA